MKQLLSVKEYAEKKGITRQAVYYQMRIGKVEYEMIQRDIRKIVVYNDKEENNQENSFDNVKEETTMGT